MRKQKDKKIKNILNALASSYPTDIPEGLLISFKADIKSLLVITQEQKLESPSSLP